MATLDQLQLPLLDPNQQYQMITASVNAASSMPNPTNHEFLSSASLRPGSAVESRILGSSSDQFSAWQVSPSERASSWRGTPEPEETGAIPSTSGWEGAGSTKTKFLKRMKAKRPMTATTSPKSRATSTRPTTATAKPRATRKKSTQQAWLNTPAKSQRAVSATVRFQPLSETEITPRSPENVVYQDPEISPSESVGSPGN